MAKLNLVGTPIGNLGDITLRALDTLRTVDVIACEDTRHSLRLLNFYQIKKPLIACHKFNERESVDKICALIEAGKEDATDAVVELKNAFPAYRRELRVVRDRIRIVNRP